jgi:hypothetical protein
MWLLQLAVLAAGGFLRDSARDEPPPVDVTRAFGWRTEAVTSEIRAGAANLRSKKASEKAEEGAAAHGEYTVADPENVREQLEKAKQQLKKTEDALKEVKEYADLAEQRAYDAAKAKAEAIVAGLKSEAAAYYASLEGELAAKAKPATPDAKQLAAQKAAEPYTAAQLSAMNMVFQYNSKAKEVQGHAEAAVVAAHNAADKANQIQKQQGGSVMASRYMIQAHQLMGDANIKQGLAKRLWDLAREINQNIPVYQASARQAAAAALAR